MNKQSQEIQKADQPSIQPAPNSPARLMEMAIEKGADVSTLEKLMNLQAAFEAKESKKFFLHALSAFQSEVPELKKTKSVKFNETAYKYAPLGQITKQIAETLTKNGLSYRWKIDENQDDISVTCIISHETGHSEETKMSAKADTSGKKNAIQSRASSVTYLQRYTLIGALGLSTADEDADGQQQKQKPMSAKEWLKEGSKKITACKTRPELTKLFNSLHGSIQTNTEVKKAFKAKQSELPINNPKTEEDGK